MTITYKWQLNGVDGYPETLQGLGNVAKVVHWRCVGTLDANPTLSGSVTGFTIVHDPDASKFKNYESLTEKEILAWIGDYINSTIIKASIMEAIKDAETLTAMTNLSALPQFWKPVPKSD